MKNKAYFFINGILLNNDDPDIDELDHIDLDNKYFYSVYNYGVGKDLEKCKSGAIWDLTTTVFGSTNIIPNTYVAIFEIEVEEYEYEDINESYAYADFDMWEKIIENKDKLIYSGKYDENKNYMENFIDSNEIKWSDRNI